MQPRIVDEFDHGFGWIREEDPLERASHAVLVGGGVWLTDVVDAPGVDERIGALGEPAGVVQLVDRHKRDCAAIATRLGIPLHVTPFGGVPEAPFEVISVTRRRWWREVALWFPAQQILVVGDALGTVSYFLAGDEPVGVHPLLRFAPPRRAFAELEPIHVLCGHGQGGHGEGVPVAVHEALATARRRLPRAWLSGIPDLVRRGR